ncbi:MAG: hypothetical protein IJZ72_04530 [Oscillospiraceae bacterium]|nr:hypothetical protein [Oscillospiraceae bacterium]
MLESKEEFEEIHIDIRSKFSKVGFIVLMVINIAIFMRLMNWNRYIIKWRSRY